MNSDSEWERVSQELEMVSKGVGDDWSQMMEIVNEGLGLVRQGVTVVEVRIGDAEVRVGDGQVL
jgi:hypothetical protein